MLAWSMSLKMSLRDWRAGELRFLSVNCINGGSRLFVFGWFFC